MEGSMRMYSLLLTFATMQVGDRKPAFFSYAYAQDTWAIFIFHFSYEYNSYMYILVSYAFKNAM